MFNKNQEGIHKGLLEIGEQIGNFYSDAVRLIDPGCTISSKVNLIAHLAREIDSGLRSVFSPKTTTVINENETIVEKKTHFETILFALGKDKNDPLAKEWHAIAGQFAGLAHRSGAHKATKDPKVIELLWNRYEEVLQRVIGSFYGVTNRIDEIIKLPAPTEEILDGLGNLLANPKNANYFFVNLRQPGWLEPLIQRGYYTAAAAPESIDDTTFPRPWYAVYFLLTLAKEKQTMVYRFIAETLQGLQRDYLQDKYRLNPYTIRDIANTLSELDGHSFSTLDADFFTKFSSAHSGAWLFYASTLSENLPVKLLKEKDVNGSANFLNYFFEIGYYTEDTFTFEDLEVQGSTRSFSLMEGHLYQAFIQTFAASFSALLGLENIRIVARKIVELSNKDPWDLQRLPSVEHSSQSHLMHEWSHYFVEYMVTAIHSLSPDERQEIAREFVHSKTSMLQRIGFHLIREHFDNLHPIFWEFIAQNKLTSDIVIHEPYVLLESVSAQFTEQEFSAVVDWIESIGEEPINDVDEQRVKDTKSYYMKRWLKALRPSGDANKKLHDEKTAYYQELCPYSIDHPAFDSLNEAHAGFDTPLPNGEFSAMDLANQLAYISGFQPSNEDRFAIERLGELLADAVCDNPSKYIFSMEQFEDVPLSFQAAMLNGFVTILKEDELTNFPVLLDFIERQTDPGSTHRIYNHPIEYQKLFVSTVGDLIRTLVNNPPTVSFQPEELVRMQDLLIRLLSVPEFKSSTNDLPRDVHNYILNSLQGRLHLALLDVTVAWSKTVSADEAVKWHPHVSEYFTTRLFRSEVEDTDFSIVLGSRLSQLIYFDKAWVIGHLADIFPEKSPEHSSLTLSSVFSKYYRPSKPLYDIFDQHGLFTKALSLLDSPSDALDSLCKYGLLEYCDWKADITGVETIVSSILRHGNEAQLNALIKAIWKQRFLTHDQLVKLWKKLLDVLLTDIPKFQTPLRSLTWFIALFEEVTDETMALLKQSIPAFSPNDGEAYAFGRDLYKASSHSLKNTGALLVATVEQTSVLPLSASELIDLVTRLYANGYNDTANSICMYVGDVQGSTILKTFFEQHNTFQ